MMENLREIKSLRGKREKHFLKDNGEFVAYLYNEDVHYLKDGKYEEIDHTIEKKDDFFVNRSNRFTSVFDKNDKMMGIDYEDVQFSVTLRDMKSDTVVSSLENSLWYHDVLDHVDMKYEVLSDKIKESIVLKERVDFSTLEFLITTNLDLQLMEDGSIYGFRDGTLVYVIDAPFMEDGNHDIHRLVYYTLEKENDDYLLILHLDREWLEDENRVYPVVVDPTITVTNKANIYDTYIDSSNVNTNYNNTDILKVGVGKVNNKNVTYRSLLKFDLPKIGTGSTVVDARLTLFTHSSDYGYYDYNDPIDVHMLTSSWNESSATWNTMNDQYHSRIFNAKNFIRSDKEESGDVNTITSIPDTVSLTNVVRRWYAGEANYGIMLKSHREVYDASRPVHSFYSKNHKITNGNPTPYITITYVNKNGLEDYMFYEEYSFLHGGAYINRFNGNLVTDFLLGKTSDGKFPVSLNLIYNTNDVVLNHDYGYGLGYQLSLYQIIKELTIEGVLYLEYLDRDGTLHYFYEKDGNYIDEDGLGITAAKENDQYILKDKDRNQMTFVKRDNIWYLSEIMDTASNKVSIVYGDDGKISKVIDADGEEIVLSFVDDVFSVTAKEYSSKVYYENGKIVRLEGKDGSVFVSYYDIGIISKIVDVNGLSVSFEYYDVIPYKVKKMSEIGLHDTLGKSASFTYDFDVTSVIDEKGRYQTYTFNKNGNAVGVTNLHGKNSLRNGIGKTQAYASYPEKSINKLSEDRSLITSVMNYIDNSSFEKSIDDSSLGDSIMISEEASRTGRRSLKLTSSSVYERYCRIPKGKMYTFSAYVKTDIAVKMYASFTYGDGFISKSEVEIVPSSDFARYSVTFEYPEQADSCVIGFIPLEDGTTYIDDLQLEEGEIANHHNLIENGNFEYDLLENWQIEAFHGEDVIDASGAYLIEELDDGDKALHLKLDPDRTVILQQSLGLSGKKNDVFNLSFWYRNTNAILDIYGESFVAYLAFHYTKEVPGHGIMPIGINYSCDEWQFFSDRMFAEEDYDDVTLVLRDDGGVNDFRITNISLFKNVDSDVYVYDEEGNLTYVHNLNKTVDSYGYDKNNQLIGMFQPSGSNFKFEYDNRITDRLLNSISSSGISNKVTYDDFGNPVKTVIKNTRFDNSGGNYYLRFKGSEKYFNVDLSSKVIDLKEDTCSYDQWTLEKEGEYYRIGYSLLPGYYVTYFNQQFMLTKLRDNRTLFILNECKNGSYTLKLSDSNKYICYENNKLGVKEAEGVSDSDSYTNNFEDTDFSIQFYFENADSPYFIEERAEYTENGKYMKKVIDDLGNVTEYDVDLETGLVTSVCDALGGVTSYTYDTEEKMTSVTKNGKTVEYSYNAQKLLDTISLDNKKYHFIYDDFLNIKEIKVGNQSLITHTYEENNGKLLSSTYGNGDEVSYFYDELDRLIKETTMDNEYRYYYNNFGDMGKIEEVHGTYEYLYDFAKRLTYFRFNDFAIRYQYDNYSNIDEKVYQLGDTEKIVYYTYNKDDDITDISFDNHSLHYVYDDLGRLKEKSIQDFNKVTYQYLGHGNKTSFMISDYTIGEDTYHYTYDELNHITHIYKNNVLMNHYQYDDFYQLQREDDYVHQKSYGYQYDLEGNVLKKVEYVFGTDTVLKEDSYLYEDANWGDKLTKYNDEMIEYDEIGNMVKIGNNKIFTWIDGRTLKSYNDFSNNLHISYQYDKDGIRISKIVNGSETKYYTENNQIIFENRDNHMLYYIRDNEGNLEGFTYDNVLYYYMKNVSNDIIGILNSQGEKVATYEYDSWGNILAIKDGSGNSVVNNLNHIANINPFRYRSYYYDAETALYYLNSRYYSPKIGRFINADGYVSTGQGIDGYNMFVYCNNDPISLTDIDGKFSILGIVIGVVALCSAAIGGIYLATRKPKVPAPSDYRDVKSSKHNCYSYAFGLSKATDPGKLSSFHDTRDYFGHANKKYTSSQVKEFVLRDMQGKKKVRVVNKISEKLDNEYIVAMKVTSKSLFGAEVNDYHFAVQLSDGQWADKKGQRRSNYGKIDGTAAKWDTRILFFFKITYDSDTVYFAVEK